MCDQLSVVCSVRSTFLHRLQPEDWLSLMLVCKTWRDYLYEDNPLAIDWGWNNDRPIRYCAEKGFANRISSLLRNPVVNSSALDNAAISGACFHGHIDCAKLLLPLVLEPKLEWLLVALIRKHKDLALYLFESNRINLDADITIDGLKDKKTLAEMYDCTILEILVIQLDNSQDFLGYIRINFKLWPFLMKLQRWNMLDYLVKKDCPEELSLSDFLPYLSSRLQEDIDVDTAEGWIECLFKLCAQFPESKRRDICQQLLFEQITNERQENYVALSMVLLGRQQILDRTSFVEQVRVASETGSLSILEKTFALHQATEDYELVAIALQMCCMNSHKECVSWLLDLPAADPSMDDNQLLIEASERGDLDIVELLLKEPGVAGYTQQNEPLKIACQKGFLLIVDALLESSPHRCFFNLECLQIAVESEMYHIVNKILNDSPKIKFAIKPALFRSAINHPPTLGLLASHVHSKLYFSCLNDLEETVETLLLLNKPEHLSEIVDNRVDIAEFIERIFINHKFDQVNRSRTDLQAKARPFFLSCVGFAPLRCYVKASIARKMLFVIFKHMHLEVLMDVARNANDFLFSSGENYQSLVLHVYNLLCKISPDTFYSLYPEEQQNLRTFLSEANFNTFQFKPLYIKNLKTKIAIVLAEFDKQKSV